jgi:hypothetical protein
MPMDDSPTPKRISKERAAYFVDDSTGIEVGFTDLGIPPHPESNIPDAKSRCWWYIPEKQRVTIHCPE